MGLVVHGARPWPSGGCGRRALKDRIAGASERRVTASLPDAGSERRSIGPRKDVVWAAGLVGQAQVD